MSGDRAGDRRWPRALVLAVLLTTAFLTFAYEERLAHVAAVGRPVPAFSLRDQRGRLWSLPALRGRVVILNFWASWCEVCRHEAPALEAFAQRYAGRVTLLGIDWREPQATIDTYLQQYGVTYPNLRDADGRVAQEYGLTGVPETWFVGPGGVARVHWIGELTFEDLQAAYAKTTGESIDASGVGPVPAGGRADGLAWSGGVLWVATSQGLWRTADLGGQWRAAPVSALAKGFIQIVAAAGDRLYAGGSAAGLWTSPDGGRQWSHVALPPGGGPTALAVEPGAPGSAWLWLSHNGLFTTEDGGRSWRMFAPATALPADASALAVSPAGGTLWAATPAGVYRSADGGRNWVAAGVYEQVQPGAALALPAALVRSRVPLAAAGVTVASGQAFFPGPRGIWGESGGRLPGSPARAFAAVTADSSGQLWALAPNGDLYASTDAGRTWRWEPYAGGPATRGAS